MKSKTFVVHRPDPCTDIEIWYYGTSLMIVKVYWDNPAHGIVEFAEILWEFAPFNRFWWQRVLSR
jgi:hypothetical protein